MERVERAELLLLLIFAGLFLGWGQGRCLSEEREALLNFKRSLIDPYDILHDWELDEDCCMWKGIGCSNTTSHIIKLDLSWNSFKINGKEGYFYATSFVPSLFCLQHLQYLSLSAIYYSQTNIPQSIDSLTNLCYLDLSRSGFVGVIPPHLGNLTNLQHLDLSYNNVVIDMSLDMWLFRLKQLQYLSLGEVEFEQTNILQKIDSLQGLRYLDLCDSGIVGEDLPHLENMINLCFLRICSYHSFISALNLLWMSRLSSLQYLYMYNVDLMLATNWLYEIKGLSSLSILSLSFCNLQTFPTLLTNPNFSSTIKIFDLSFNHFNGSLPNWVGQFKNLKSLYLRSNNFTGSISQSSLNLLCNLNDLDLSENNFAELIDDRSILKCNEYKMEKMDISSNQLRGSIPDWVGEMRHLKCLDLSNNQISGSIPEWVGQMKHLKWLDLKNNHLTGSIPYSFGQLINLITLDLRSNLLNGSVSDVNFANVSKLNYLYLADNNLDFNMISLNWIPPFQVSSLFLRSCIIGPHFPLWLQNQKFLSILDISNSGISDIIPSWFWNISSQISYLNMSHNTIRGELPMFLNIAFEATIDLKFNLLEGQLPQSRNHVRFVSFSNNKFSSGIEWYLNSNMSSLLVLDLSLNHLLSEIPDSICQMPTMVHLDLSHNNLFGEIPKCRGNISSFMTLNFISITNNNIWGSIPQWIGKLPMLLSLHLSNNNLQGEIPVLQNCSRLIIFDLGQNNITGSIPLWIGDLLSLKILKLTSNKFQGLIPSELSKLKGLQILDLADNFLSGVLPKSLKLLSAMAIQKKKLEVMTGNSGMFFPNVPPVLSIEEYLPPDIVFMIH